MPNLLNFRQLILGMWLTWVLYWLVYAASAKRTQRRESWGSGVSHLLPLLVGLYLIVWPQVPVPWLSRQVLPDALLRYQVATAVVALGLGFTVWARVHLGRNWSGSVTQKEGHELIRSGPYAYVRHPIYTGLLVALLGSAFALGELRGVLGVLIVLASFVHKLRLEEGFMRQLFPGAYDSYAAQVPALLPFIKARRSASR